MSNKAQLIALIDSALAEFGIAGVIDLSAGTGMSHMGLACLGQFSEADCSKLLNCTIRQWMKNVGAADADILTAVSLLPDGGKPEELGVLKRFNQATVTRIIRTALGT